MKKYLIAPLLLGASLNLNAQCSEIDCADADYTVFIEDGLSTSYNGSVCFFGKGEIPNWVNWNNWDFLSFNSDSFLVVNQNINFGSFNNKVEVHNDVKLNYVSFDGGDTIFVKSGILYLNSWVSNNSTESNRNVIVLDEGTELFMAGMQYFAGSTWIGGGTGNNIKVIEGCSIPLGIIYQELSGYTKNGMAQLSWNVKFDYEFILQANIDGYWFDISFYNTGSFTYPMLKNTQFRLKVDGDYSKVLYLYYTEAKKQEGIFDIQGRKLNQITQPGIYIINGNKTFIK